jgi:hypothetical protein
VCTEEFAELLGIADTLSFADDKTLGIDDLILFEIDLRVVIKIKDFLKRAKVLLGGSVAIKTPSH